jgi:hypothetical protein
MHLLNLLALSSLLRSRMRLYFLGISVKNNNACTYSKNVLPSYSISNSDEIFFSTSAL